MVDKEDKVVRPDAYICKSCDARFNKAKSIKKEQDGLYSSISVCPSCDSSEIVVAWW